MNREWRPRDRNVRGSSINAQKFVLSPSDGVTFRLSGWATGFVRSIGSSSNLFVFPPTGWGRWPTLNTGEHTQDPRRPSLKINRWGSCVGKSERISRFRFVDVATLLWTSDWIRFLSSSTLSQRSTSERFRRIVTFSRLGFLFTFSPAKLLCEFLWPLSDFDWSGWYNSTYAYFEMDVDNFYVDEYIVPMKIINTMQICCSNVWGFSVTLYCMVN